MRTLIQVQSIPPRTPPQPVEWFGPMPPIGSEMTIVGVKHEVVKYSYDVEYDISVDQAVPQSKAAIDAPYGYMRCTQLTIHLKPKHREQPSDSLIASLIESSNASLCKTVNAQFKHVQKVMANLRKGQAVEWNDDGTISGYVRRNTSS